MSPEELARIHGVPAAPDVAREIDGWEAELNRFLDGELPPEKWRMFRLGYGVYGQRQPDVQMIRVKIPGGILSGAQLVQLADLTEQFSGGVAHLTTRQDVQLYYVALRRVPALLRGLADAGLTTREACGNSVRNVTACPVSGFIAEEWFDVRPYALAVTSFLMRNAFCQQMARKFKISFSACPEDCAAAAIHDIGALGAVTEVAGRTQYGFRLVVGGGLGPTPFLARPLAEFVPLAELLTTVKAILKVYADLGNRRNRGMARLKFVVNRLGHEEFRRRVFEARAALDEAERAEAELIAHVPEESMRLVAGHLEGRPSLQAVTQRHDLAKHRPAIWASDWLSGDDDGFLRWQSCSVRPHRDPDHAVVTVLVPLGDLASNTLRSLGRLARAYGDDQARVARDQNLVFPNVRRGDLRGLYRDLSELGLAEYGVGTALDVTSCPGADTCRLGITSSKGLARAIRAELLPKAKNGGLAILRDVTIKMSGCPNSCGQHHVANIGFHGVVKSFDGRQSPAYQVHLGGRTTDGSAAVGRALAKVHARSAPKVVAAFLELYREERRADESFADFAARLPEERAREILKPFAEGPPEDAERFVDWGQSGPFSTDDLGVGECAGAGDDVVADPFDNYRVELKQISLFLSRGQFADALANLNRSQYTLARVLLGSLKKKPESDYEATCEIRAQVIDRGHMSDRWDEMHEDIAIALRSKHPDPAFLRGIYAQTSDLLEEAARALSALQRRANLSADFPG